MSEPLTTEGWSWWRRAALAAKVKFRRWIVFPAKRVFICSWRGHNYDGTESGFFLAGPEIHKAHVWCSRCDKFQTIPREEIGPPL